MADTIRDADAPLHSTHNHRQPTEHTAAPAFGLHHGPRGRWLCDFYAGRNRIRRSTGTRDLAEAVRICARWLDGGLEALPRPRALQHTLADVAERIAEEHRDGRLSAGSVRLYHDRIAFFRAWHLRTCGHEAVLHRLDAAVIRRYIAWRQVTPVTRNGRAQGDRRLPSPRTVVHDLDTLRAVFRRAIKLGWMERDPTAGIVRDRKAYGPRIAVLDGERIRTFLAALHRRTAEPGTSASGLRLLPAFCEATFACGMRREETRLLTRSDVDLRRQVVRIRAKNLRLHIVLQMTWAERQALLDAAAEARRPGRPRLPEYVPTTAAAAGTWHPESEALTVEVPVEWRPKGGGRERDIPIPPRAIPLFERLISADLATWYPDAPQVRLRHGLGLPEPDLLFPGAEGGLLRSNMNREVNLAARDAGIGRLRIHDLRHAFATQIRAAGVELCTIQSLLGHEDLKTTQIYAHYTDQEGRLAVGNLSW